jgi:uncharacterized cupin superfamily protein
MADITVTTVEDVDPYQGPGAIPGIRFRGAARALGVTAWGMNVIELEPGCDRYPEHDHAADGQEEVYFVLRGRTTLRAGADEWQLEPGALVRVGPNQKRKFVTAGEGVTLLAIGATPGKAYERRR